MDWRPAPSVKLGLTEATERWPDRNTAADGILGDAAHSARTSDHNPDENGVVHAFDLTHDPDHGVDCGRLSRLIVERRDPRLRYVIFNRRICKGPWSDGVMAGRSKPWVWEEYTGPNPHDHHMHVSVGYGTAPENDLRPWYGPTPEEDNSMSAEDVAALKKYLDGKFTDLTEQLRRVDHGDGTEESGRTGRLDDNDHATIRRDIADLAERIPQPPPEPAP